MNTLGDGVTLTSEELLALRFHARHLKLPSFIKSRSAQHGTHLSNRLGRGMELSEVRQYQNGDDIRTLDWKVTARTGIPHTKLFHEERDRSIILLIDLGSSMRFATRTALKSIIAAQLATLIAWAAHQQRDKIGAILYTDDKLVQFPPRGQQEQVIQLIHSLVKTHAVMPQEEDHPHRFIQACRQLNQLSRPGNLCCLISDFMHFDNQCAHYLSLLAAHNQVLCLSVTDPLERQLAGHNSLSFSDGKHRLVFDANDPKQRARYADYYQTLERKLTEYTKQRRIAYAACLTTDPILPFLKETLHRWTTP